MNPSTHPPIKDVLHELQGASVPQLVARYHGLFGKPPRSKHRQWLFYRCAWQEQAIRFGGLSGAAKKRIAEIQAELQLPGLSPKPRSPRKSTSGEPPVGTRLEREWRGTLVVAVRTTNGWEVNGMPYRSLSAGAKAVSGSHVSGPAFFGLTGRGRG
ncbi:hypothetical protein Poly30_27740 [Planctomycetes bacterium Poly30]|uniref:DUF2924 domain-containing protein n=1 Tax=Saltatorellus ferox TaxID=2528018 RepID=A0A518ET58_9BACT|nr:hypothetical protein Poly30_27740 [Planctomycetes bacterium Poly30]